MSKMSQEILYVCKEVADFTCRKVGKMEILTVEHMQLFVRDAFDKAALHFGVSKGTVRSTCTRTLDYRIEAFVEHLKNLIMENDQTLVDQVVACCRKHKGNDNPENIRAEFTAIRKNALSWL